MEVAIPFKSLRYRGSGAQTWGINLRRLVKWKNEFSYLSLGARGARHRRRQPHGVGGHAGRHRDAGAVEEPRAEAVRGVVADDRSNRRREPFDNDPTATPGFDFKYGLTRSLIVDATYRTDFAQVEEDLQQVNLTRFSLFFPEKRDFFLEGQGIFEFGGVQAGNTPGRRADSVLQPADRPERGQAVPVVGGARLTGRAGRLQHRRAQHPDRRRAVGDGRSPRTSPRCGSSATSCGAATSA